MSRIGTLALNGPDPVNAAAFLQGLRDLGWVEGETLAVEHRFGRVNEALVARVAELIDRKVDVIVATGNETIRVASSATGAIPIVMTVSDDPVAAGLVASLAHPGGNVTGLTSLSTELGAKRLQLLKEASPGIARVAILWDPAVQGRLGEDPTLGVAAGALGLQLERCPFGVGGIGFGEAFEAAAAGGADGVLLLTDQLAAADQSFLRGIFAKTRLPTMVGNSEFARDGGLLAYGPSVPDLFRRAATYVDKILRGAKAADLPVEQPTTFEFVINLKTAQGLGLTIPQAVLQQATEIIQ